MFINFSLLTNLVFSIRPIFGFNQFFFIQYFCFLQKLNHNTGISGQRRQAEEEESEAKNQEADSNEEADVENGDETEATEEVTPEETRGEEGNLSIICMINKSSKSTF